MNAEVFDLWTELGEKWSTESLTKRLSERISEHITTNTITRETLLGQVQKFSKKYCM